MIDVEIIREELSLTLSKKRYEHSLFVAKRAKELAGIYGVDVDSAYIAGLVHDSCKEIPKEEQLKIINRFGIILTDVEKFEPNIWHGYAASGYITEKWGIVDTDICDAVKYHTCGRKNMSVLEKIIFVADLTSEDREYEDSKPIRVMSETSLDLAIYNCYLYIIPFIVNRKGRLTENTIGCYNDAVNHILTDEKS